MSTRSRDGTSTEGEPPLINNRVTFSMDYAEDGMSTRKSTVNLLGKSSFPIWATIILSLLWGLFFGALVFVWCAFVLSFGYTISSSIGGAFAVLMAVLTMVSKPFRCSIAVAVTGMSLPAGHVFLLGLGFAIILSGPVMNIISNTEIFVASITCLSQVYKNETRAVEGLMHSPYVFVEKQLMQAQQGWDTMSKPVKDQVDHVNEELEVFVDSVNDVSHQISKISTRCHNTMDSFNNTCSNELNILKSKCENTLNLDNAKTHLKAKLCEKLEIFCDEFERRRWKRSIPSGIEKICHALDIQPYCNKILRVDEICTRIRPPPVFRKFQSATSRLQRKVSWFQDAMDFKITRKFNQQFQRPHLGHTAEDHDINVTLRTYYERVVPKLMFVRIVITIVESLASLSFVVLLWKSFSYVRRYITSDKFDNQYITNTFRAYDRSRIPLVLLPLQGYERRKYREIEKMQITIGNVMGGLAVLVMNFIVAILFFGFDSAMITIMRIIQKYSGRIDLTFVNKTGIADFEIDGSGPVSQFFHSFLEGFKKVADPKIGESIKQCIFEPVPLSPTYLYLGGVLYALVLVACFIDGDGYRYRNIVTSWFYPKRQNERAVALYNRMSKDRAKGTEYIRRKVDEKLAERARAKEVHLIRTSKAEVLDKCIACGKSKSDKTLCATCGATYCTTCWKAHGNKCVTCDF